MQTNRNNSNIMTMKTRDDVGSTDSLHTDVQVNAVGCVACRQYCAERPEGPN